MGEEEASEGFEGIRGSITYERSSRGLENLLVILRQRPTKFKLRPRPNLGIRTDKCAILNPKVVVAVVGNNLFSPSRGVPGPAPGAPSHQIAPGRMHARGKPLPGQ